MSDLAARLRAALGAPDPAPAARLWCAQDGIPALEGPARGDTVRAAAAALRQLAVVADSAGSGLGLIRPAFAQQLAARAGEDPAVAAALAAYTRAAPPAEALAFAADWAVAAWEGFCAAPQARRRTQLATALAVAALAIGHALAEAGGPPVAAEAYNAAVEVARDLFLQLAHSAPPAGSVPPGLVADLLAAGADRARELGYPPAAAARVVRLERICREYGRSLPGARERPGLPYLA